MDVDAEKFNGSVEMLGYFEFSGVYAIKGPIVPVSFGLRQYPIT